MSFGLPPSTEVSRQLPKKAIIERFGLSGKERTKAARIFPLVIDAL